MKHNSVVVSGTGVPFNVFAAAMFATSATAAQKPAAIIPHRLATRTNRDRAYDLAIAGGCKATTPTLDGHDRDTINLGTNATTGRHTFDDATEFARQATKQAIAGATAFANDFGAAVGTNQANWNPAFGAS